MLETLLNLDSSILLWIQNHCRADWLDPIVALYTQLGNVGICWIVITFVLLARKKTRSLGLVSGIALLFGLLFTNLLIKPLVARDRPWVALADYLPLLYSSDPYSFPSGHTTAAFAASLSWLRLAPGNRWSYLSLCAAVLMGLSRLYVGVHYPSDVLAGVLAGALAALCATGLLSRLQEKFPRLHT